MEVGQQIKWQGWTLYHKQTNQPVVVGTVMKDTNGEAHVITGGRPPHKPSSSGRIWYQLQAHPDASGEFYPNVFDMEWRQDNAN